MKQPVEQIHGQHLIACDFESYYRIPYLNLFCRDFTISIGTHNTRGKQVFLIKWIVHETAIHFRLLFKEIVLPGHPKSYFSR